MISGRTPEEYRDFFAEVFADLDGNPRKTGVRFKAEDLVIEISNGNPSFVVGSGTPEERRLDADFRGRWLPEHPVPLRFQGGRTHTFRLTPTTGNRVKVALGSHFMI